MQLTKRKKLNIWDNAKFISKHSVKRRIKMTRTEAIAIIDYRYKLYCRFTVRKNVLTIQHSGGKFLIKLSEIHTERKLLTKIYDLLQSQSGWATKEVLGIIIEIVNQHHGFSIPGIREAKKMVWSNSTKSISDDGWKNHLDREDRTLLKFYKYAG